MPLNLAPAPSQYDQADEAQQRRALEAEDKKTVKTGQVLDKLLFKDTATGAIKTVVVTSGAFVIT